MSNHIAQPTINKNQTAEATKIAVAYGDGIGPEITSATLHILEAAAVPLTFEPVEMG